MKYLADTPIWHRAIFSAELARRPLSEAVLAIWRDEPDEIALCDISILELSRHLRDDGNPPDVCMAALSQAVRGLEVLAIDPQTAVRSVALDWPRKKGDRQHLDPADRLIVATALAHGLALLSEDEEIIHCAPKWGLTVIS